jgi:hypothetical protein
MDAVGTAASLHTSDQQQAIPPQADQQVGPRCHHPGGRHERLDDGRRCEGSGATVLAGDDRSASAVEYVEAYLNQTLKMTF